MSTLKVNLKKVDEEGSWAELQKFMNALHDETDEHIRKIAEELSITQDCAADVWYLRSRSRWTQDLEDKLIDLHKQGQRPNMCEFG